MKTIFSVTKKNNPVTGFLKSQAAHYLNSISKENNNIRRQRMAIFANDWIGINLNLYGVYELSDLSLIFDFLKPLHSDFASGVALDVGANIGNHSVFFDRFFAETIAFEPNASTYELLKFNAKYANSVTALDYGLGDVNAELDLQEDQENFGGSAIVGCDNCGTVKVKVKRLDDSGLDLKKLCLIKIDVEGFEANVISGAKNAICTYRPIILFEQNEGEFKNGTPKTISLLREMGYSFCWVNQKKLQSSWIGRRFQNLFTLVGGWQIEKAIVSASELPVATYSMVIGVPDSLQKKLGL